MRLTASQMGRAVNCGYWMRDEVELEPDRPSVYARLGTAFHDAAEITLLGQEPNLAHIAAFRALPTSMAQRLVRLYDRWRLWWDTYHGDHPWLPEVKMAMSADGVARLLPSSGPRDYKCEPGEIPGTADAVGANGGLVLVDWKTSSQWIPPAREHSQLRFLGAAAAKIHSADTIRIAICRVSDMGIFYDEHEMTATEIAETIEDVGAIIRMTATAEPNPGPWCKETYCRAKGCVGRERAA